MESFSADEVFAMAEQIERNGAKFYRTAAEQASEDRARKRLRELADWEHQHEQLFARMRSELSGAAGQPSTFDPDDEAAMYLRAFVDGKVFDVNADPSARLTGKESPTEVLDTALGLEKDSIVFYLGIRGLVPASMGTERIDRIIKEEMSHVRLLSDEKAELS